MDSLRAAMMVAGVFFHAAMVYRPDKVWRFADPSDLSLFDWITDGLHTFRMPAFFAVAGFFCAYVFAREHGVRKLYGRLTVFAVPFVVMVLTLQPLQYAMKLLAHGGFHGFGAEFWRVYFHDGEYISHLWFLINLSFYYLIAWLAVRYAKNAHAGHPWVAQLFRHKTLMSAVACACFLPFHRALGDASIGTEYELQDLFQFAPFFLVGYIVFRHGGLFADFRRIGILDVLATLVLLLTDGFRPESHLGHALDILTFYQVAFVATGACMALFHKFFDSENRFTRLVADSAYTVYLLHQLLVVLFASWIAHHLGATHALVKYSLVVLAVLLTTITLHHLLIARVPLLRFLLNGRLGHTLSSGAHRTEAGWRAVRGSS
jgi:glucan biosynthesis protein C